MRSGGWRVTLFDARRYAAVTDGWREEYHNRRAQVVSFLRDDGGARINVYYRRGTVATVLTTVDGGRTQLLRSGVETGLLERLFANPRLHEESLYEVLGEERIFERRLPDEVKDVVDSEYAALEAHVRSIDEERMRLEKHREGLVARMEAMRNEDEGDDDEDEEKENDFEGNTAPSPKKAVAPSPKKVKKRSRDELLRWDQDFYANGGRVSLFVEQ